MIVAIIAVVIVGLALILTKVVTILAGIALMVVGLFAIVAIGERRDRSRQRGIRDPLRRLDVNRGVVPTAMDLDTGGEDQPRTYADALVASALADRGESARTPGTARHGDRQDIT